MPGLKTIAHSDHDDLDGPFVTGMSTPRSVSVGADALDNLKKDCVHKDIWRENVGYDEKGPFPLPDISVMVRQLSRNDDTGYCKLRLTPIDPDTIYAEVGGKATSASEKLTNRDYETGALEVSFLAMDSVVKYNTGKPYTWRNDIAIKSHIYQSGDDKMLELRSAPVALLRYTTDGSEPRNSCSITSRKSKPIWCATRSRCDGLSRYPVWRTLARLASVQ